MSLAPWDPWKELEHLREETDQRWNEFLTKLAHGAPDTERISFLPDVDFVETSQEYFLYLSVPGFVEEDIDLAISERSLIVRGERQPPYDPVRSQRRLTEWRYGYFERRFQFTGPIRAEDTRATYDAGVLTIVLPKRMRNEGSISGKDPAPPNRP